MRDLKISSKFIAWNKTDKTICKNRLITNIKTELKRLNISKTEHSNKFPKICKKNKI